MEAKLRTLCERIALKNNAEYATLYFIYCIRLRTCDFCEVIVDDGEARINYYLIEIESE